MAAGSPLTLEQALAQARLNAQQAQAAITTANLAAEDRKQARAALLPSLSAFSQYTTPRKTARPRASTSPTTARTCTRRGSRSTGTCSIRAGGPNTVARRRPRQWLVRARMWRRAGSSRPSCRTTTPSSGRRGRRRTQIRASRKRRRSQDHAAAGEGGEVAHADVVKAQIQVAQRQRDAQEAALNALKSRLGLAGARLS